MKRVTLFLLLSFFVGFNAMSQITTTIVDFEKAPAPTDPTSNYTVTSTYYERLDTLKVEGNHSIRLIPNRSEDVTLTIKNIEKKANQQVMLEFYHMCMVRTNIYESSGNQKTAWIEVKRSDASDAYWTMVEGQYIVGNEYETLPPTTSGNFSNGRYSDWGGAAGNNFNLRNSNWKREVFLLNVLFNGAQGGTSDKYDIRFVVRKVDMSGTGVNDIKSDEGWYFDDIKVKVSPIEMIRPNITMLSYPTPLYYPENSPAKVSAYVRDTAIGSEQNGIHTDSSYLVYKYGSEKPKKMPLRFVSKGERKYDVDGNIPFQGYDTLVEWKLVIRDSSENINERTFPENNGWSQFKYTRSIAYQDSLGKGKNTGYIPLYMERNGNSESRSYVTEFVYDKEVLQNNGYGPSIIDALKLKIIRSVRQQNNLSLTIKMKNITKEEALVSHSASAPIWGTNMQEVYHKDSYSFPEVNNDAMWLEDFLEFGTPFKYTGEYLLLQICVANNNNNLIEPLVLKGIEYAREIPAIYLQNGSPLCNPMGAAGKRVDSIAKMRPDVIFRTMDNAPIEYDLGISKIVSPIGKVYQADNHIQVQLRNFGNKSVNNIRIYYKVDEDGVVNSHDYTSTILGLNIKDSLTVTPNKLILEEGIRRIYSWTDDSLSANGLRFRDYEELNNLAYDSVFVCPTFVEGKRTIGLTKQARLASIQEALNFVKECGIHNDLEFDIWSGIYETQKIVFPEISGLDTYSILFKAHPDSNAVVSFQINDLTEGGLIDFANARNIRFENIKFQIRGVDNNSVSLVDISSTLGKNKNIKFVNCQFVSEVNINTLVRAVGSNQLIIDSCTFEGAKEGVGLSSASSGRKGVGNIIRNSKFQYQNEVALSANNQTGLIVENNEFISQNKITSNYVVRLGNCTESPRIVSNTIYSEAGASGVIIAGVNGTKANPALFANNMISVDGISALTAVELQSTKHLDFVYNSVRIMSENTKQVPMAARIGAQGVVLDTVIIKNNIFYNAKKGFSVHIIPNGYIESDYNNYWKTESDYLAMYGTGSSSLCSSLDTLQMKSNQDRNSLNKKVVFINNSNLRTYTLDLIGKGTPVSSIDVDKYGTNRDGVFPCIGAFEYEKLPINIGIDELQITPTDGCGLGNEPVSVLLRNQGKNTISFVTLHCQIVGNTTNHTQTYSSSIVADQSIQFTFKDSVNLSVDRFKKDSVFKIKVWVDNLTEDLDTGNDTIYFNVLSLYQLEGTKISPQSVEYEHSLNLNIHNLANPPLKDSIYWFDKDDNQIGYGAVYNTGTLYDDTTYYVAQMHEEAVLKFTEIQLALEGNGMQLPYPYQDIDGNRITPNLAFEISNLGNIDAHLLGDSVKISGGKFNRTFPLPDIILQPKKSLVILFSGKSVSSNPLVVYLEKANTDSIFDANTTFLLYSKSGADTICYDYVCINEGPPNDIGTVWKKGSFVATKETGTAGIRRVSQDPNASAWFVLTDEQPMTLGALEDALMVYNPDKNCMGKKTPVVVNVTGIPEYDAVVSFVSQDQTECNLQDEKITIKITNRGNNEAIPAGALRAYFSIDNGTSLGGEIVNDTIEIPAKESITYTFNQTADLRSPNGDKEFTIKAFIDRLPGEKNAGK
ncbi:hypothetical protein LJC16_02740, partial [Bacteroidales bacterium OttesenSCG-928-C19]|nr:hypothetical protein [Bacteroidales bacterium OttesenSCG-928-C19]